ncbi:MAG: CHAD domain-containing protein [Acidimicrobiales bacterium]
MLEPSESLGHEVPRVVRERMKIAIRLLDDLDPSRPDDVDRMVHDIRKRCKEVRAVARLVRPAIGSEYHLFNASVQAAAEMLAPIRDAHAMRNTFDDLRERQGRSDDDALDVLRATQTTTAHQTVRGLDPDDPRVIAARLLLKASRKRVKSWDIPDDFDVLGVGIARSYRQARKGFRRIDKDPTDKRSHDWRTSVKHLWYQMRLVERAAPSVLNAYAVGLGDLAEALGDDHDLSLLITALKDDPSSFGGKSDAKAARRLAAEQQADLRGRAIRLGATLFAEHPDAFVRRIEAYWIATVSRGPELPTGGIAELTRDERPLCPAPDVAPEPTTDSAPAPAPEPVAAPAPEAAPVPEAASVRPSTMEHERKYLVDRLPMLGNDGVELRQGYLAIDDSVAVRVRDDAAGGRTLTIKAGRGASRTELEWPIDEDEFIAAWTATRGRRIRKTRHRIPYGPHIIELDVFHGHLEGLVMAEVEFESVPAMTAFSPPSWFGLEVTDDDSYTNAALATDTRSFDEQGLPVSRVVR